MATYSEAKAAGAKYYNGKPCPLGHTRRYVKTNGCAECHRAITADLKLTLVEDIAPAAPPAVPVIRLPGKCKHGQSLRGYCHPCEISWRAERPAGRRGSGRGSTVLLRGLRC